MTIYTYGKTLLAPGQRIGYAALHPAFPDRGGGRLPDLRPAAGLRLGLSRTRCCSTPSPTSRRCRSTSRRSRRGATGWSRCCASWATSRPIPEGTFYLMARSPGPRRPGLHRPAGRARRAGPARLDRRVPGLVPHLADRQRRDGRTRAGGVPRRGRGARRRLIRRPARRAGRPSVRVTGRARPG